MLILVESHRLVCLPSPHSGPPPKQPIILLLFMYLSLCCPSVSSSFLDYAFFLRSVEVVSPFFLSVHRCLSLPSLLCPPVCLSLSSFPDHVIISGLAGYGVKVLPFFFLFLSVHRPPAAPTPPPSPPSLASTKGSYCPVSVSLSPIMLSLAPCLCGEGIVLFYLLFLHVFHFPCTVFPSCPGESVSLIVCAHD